MNDKEIIELIRNNKQQKAFVKIYKHFKIIRNMVRERGGNKEDAQDIFQESLIIFCRKCEDKNFELNASISTYLFSVCKFLWNDELKKRNSPSTGSGTKFVELSDNFSEEEIGDVYEEEKKFKKAEIVLNKIGEKCLQLLKLFYNENKTMKEIAKKMELSSEKIAKNQKYKCLERAKESYRNS